MQEYGYVNDYNYAESFVRNKSHLMSKRELEYKLLENHIAKDIVKQVLEDSHEEADENTEKRAFFNLYRKKNVNYGQLDAKEKQKLIGYFLRKGFLYDDIVSYFREIEKFNENETEESLT